MKKLMLSLVFMSCFMAGMAQTSFIVGGDLDKFYPVVFADLNWNNNSETQLELGRSDVHKDADWRGSLISTFRFHTTRWGHGSRFTDVDIRQDVPFIAGYRDATVSNASYDFVIWLKGGGTTYYVKSGAVQNPRVYDGIQNALPYQEINGPAHSFKTSIDSYVNSSGKSDEGTIYSRSGGLNYLNGNLGLGTTDTKGFKLAVNGKMRAQEIKVQATDWPDYVFEKGYKVGTLEELESYIKANKHLPDMPGAQEVEANGLAVSEMLKLQQQKIEELTLHLIEKDKNITQLAEQLKLQAEMLKAFSKQLKTIEKFKNTPKN
ncbi:hypothetical protein ACFE6N_23125 [Pedobacter sp. BG31]|uniref:hypothetical protein n=1 Tax=Pedobacter sp. BG31 TaxID=3349697 RepID=UPI0035F38F5F